MMTELGHYGIWSLIPPLLAILLAIRTRQVFVALMFGIWLGWVILNDWNPITGTVASIQALVAVFSSESNTKTIMFSALVGALIAYIQRSGGVNGFVAKVEAWLKSMHQPSGSKKRKIVQGLAALTGILIFVESSISVLTVGSIYRPVFDKLGISREKLAYIADSSSAPSCILIPFNAWGAYILGLLTMQNLDQPIYILAKAFFFNFYPLLAIGLVAAVIITGWDFGPMKKAEHRTRELGELMNQGSQPVVSSEITSMEAKEGIKPRTINMMLPILTMVAAMPVMLILTGWPATTESTFPGQVIQAIGNGSGSTSVLYSVLLALLVSALWYRVTGIMNLPELIEVAFKGIGGLIPIALLMMFAFAIGTVCQELGTGKYVAEVTRNWLTPALIPAVLFLVSALIAFATGTSWGTFAIMMAIAVPVSQASGANLYMAVAAVMGGGVFGDHCSPISDTTILSSMAAATDHIDHVKTQLPYALMIGLVSTLLYLITGVVFA